jgi:heterodisulfide reductase subunit A-like polyferredoxin
MKAHQNGSPMLASSGYVAQVNSDLCIGCEDCQDYCQFNAISTQHGTSLVDVDACMGCGVCEAHCQQGAISLILDARRGIPLEIDKLISQAAEI